MTFEEYTRHIDWSLTLLGREYEVDGFHVRDRSWGQLREETRLRREDHRVDQPGLEQPVQGGGALTGDYARSAFGERAPEGDDRGAAFEQGGDGRHVNWR